MPSLQEEAEKYRPDVERGLPYVEHRTIDELREEVGNLPISQEFAAEAGRPGLKGAEAGFLLENHARVRAAVCRNQQSIGVAIETGNVSMLVAALLPVLGLPGVNIPLGAIALAVLVLRIGLNEYCRGFTEEDRTGSA